jgi:PAS domain S-box-containing protein
MAEELQYHELDDLKKAYHDLQINEERYRLIADHVRDVIWTMKLDGSITYISPAVEAVRGLTVEEAKNQAIHEILTPDSIVKVGTYMQEQYLAYISGMPLSSFKGEVDYYRKDGSILHTEVLTYPILGEDIDSTLILGVTRDITERKLFESKLLEQAQILNELNATKDKFFSIIAHDLKNPIRSILGFSELLQEEAKESENKSISSYADILYSSAKQTAELLENLLDWANGQQNSFPFSPSEVVINELISEEINILRPLADQKNIKLVDSTAGQIRVTADKKMIGTVIRNLISNAIKFTKKDGSILVEACLQPESAVLTVTDTGIGMSKENIAKLFHIVDGFTTRGTENEKGTGLGLVLCKEFIEKHGGEIQVSSELGKGSQFRFSIPL